MSAGRDGAQADEDAIKMTKLPPAPQFSSLGRGEFLIKNLMASTLPNPFESQPVLKKPAKPRKIAKGKGA